MVSPCSSFDSDPPRDVLDRADVADAFVVDVSQSIASDGAL
jgi:hypothetical protein